MINLILFGGLSESGKSHASKYSEKNGFKHMKIIYFEQKIMHYFKIDSNSKEYDPFYMLYNRKHNDVFEKLWYEIKLFCAKHNIQNISMDSTTRVDMVDFFQNQENINFISLYIEADFLKRAKREYKKVGNLSFLEVKQKTKEKDKIKLSRKANMVKHKSICVANNGDIYDFETKLFEVFEILKKYSFKQKKNTLFISKEVNIKYLDIPKTEYPFIEYSFISKHFIKIKL